MYVSAHSRAPSRRFARTMLMASGALVATLYAGAAAAQTAPANTTPAGEANTSTVDEIVVTGVRASLEKGLQIKKQSTQVVESVVAEDVGKLPDNNVVEALQRVTGVQVTDRTGGEAATISIRGLPDVETTWNGRDIFTASGQYFSLSDVPANLVSRLDVYKTRAADQLETGIAGQIDVQTHRPFDFKGPAFTFAATDSYLQQSGRWNPNINILASDRWTTPIGDIGALVNLSYTRTRYRDMSVTAGALVPFATADNPPAGWTPLERIFPTDGRASGQQLWQPGTNSGLPETPGSTLHFNGQSVPYLLSRDAIFQNDLTGDRRRPAINVALQWAPNDRSEYYLEGFYDGYRNETYNAMLFSFMDWWGNLGPNPGSSYTLYPGTNLMHTRTVGSPSLFTSGDLTTSSTDTYVVATGGKWELTPKLHAKADLSYETSIYKTQFTAMRLDTVMDSLSVNLNNGGGIPGFHFNNDALLANPAQWNIGEFYDNANRNTGDAYTVSADLVYDADWGPLQKISFGGRWDKRKAAEAQRTGSAGQLGVPSTSITDPGFFNVNNGFMDGRADVPSSWLSANGYFVRENVDYFRQLYGLPTGADLALTNNFNIDQVTKSAYLMGDFEEYVFDRPLRVNAGVRYVKVNTDMAFTDLLAADGVVTNASKDVSSVLPSVTVRYDLTKNLRVRFNYGETLRMPNFTDLNPNFILTDDLTNIGYGQGTGGNPNLRPTKAKNLDFTVEWYFDHGSAIYGTLFRRNIDGLVVPFRRVVDITNPNYKADTFIITQPDNASNGVLQGFELGFVYFPDYLPGLFKGLGLQGSLTKLSSSQNIPLTDTAGNVVGQQKTQFFDVSPISYNLTLAYDRGPLGARMSYVWRSPFLYGDEAPQFANPIGIWHTAESSLDFQLTYNINDRLAWTFDAVNLLNSTTQSYYAFDGAGSPQTTNFGTTLLARTFAVGVRYSFK
jgi:TonB-dependent receptor